ncbi:flocculation protein FLO11-like isoform X2 [Penaeus chinensis]|uniref:flocculation protein FLO11-like isoform X2 n=1 Tax=Penaeus chinensis TaxID=139456 RepID=UPI001FB84E99|nr:flocculation protein FLO11-like isoform X2 [Penaeus chinensis]
MRSGQYKLSGTAVRVSHDDVMGQFRSTREELPPAESPVGDFPHMNSLVLTMNKISEPRPPRGLNKSSESVSGARCSGTKVEKRVKNLLQKGGSLRQEPPTAAKDTWQYGHVVTLPRRPRLALPLSHSTHDLVSSSDTASCLSASSGYSSSSSSSYGSFKSGTSSNCSTMPRKKCLSECSRGEDGSPHTPTRSCTLIDNPMYDLTPGSARGGPLASSHDPRPARRVSGSEPRIDELHRRGDPDMFFGVSRCRGSPSPKPDPEYDAALDGSRASSRRYSRRRSSSVPRPDPAHDHFSVADDLGHRHRLRSGSKRRSPLPADPIYDVIPGEVPSPRRRFSYESNFYETAQPSRLASSHAGSHMGSQGALDSLGESGLDSLEFPRAGQGDDQVARECREYFQRRLKNSETLRKRWSTCSADSGADSADSEVSPSSSSSQDPAPQHASGSPDVTSAQDAASGAAPAEGSRAAAASKKTPLDCKMQFLRKEIASLINQDNDLFRQLLTLHESISALKSTPAHTHNSPSPDSLDSFTEEEEEEEEDEDDDDDDDVLEDEVDRDEDQDERVLRKVLEMSDVDEGLEMDHSLSHSASPTSTLSSKSSSRSQDSHYSQAPSVGSSPAHSHSPLSFCRTSRTPPTDPYQHRHAHAQQHHSLPDSHPSAHEDQHAHTEHQSAAGQPAFMRSRKSYAPTARNRRRSSSAHLLCRPELEGHVGPEYQALAAHHGYCDSGAPFSDPGAHAEATIEHASAQGTLPSRPRSRSAVMNASDTPTDRPRSASTAKSTPNTPKGRPCSGSASNASVSRSVSGSTGMGGAGGEGSHAHKYPVFREVLIM